MGELWEQATRIHNFPLTVVLGLLLAYWLLTVLGIFGSDGGVEADADVDLDVDAGVDGDIGAGGHGGEIGGVGMLRFFGLGDVPAMVMLTVLVMSMWVIAILSNYVLNPGGSVLVALLLAVPNFVVSLFVMKYAVMPLKPLYRKMREDADAPEPVVGRTGTVRSSEVTEAFGQVEVPTRGTPLYVHARTAGGDEVLRKGDEALIYKFVKETGVYLVRKIGQ